MPLAPACVLLVVPVFCDALVLWFVVAFGLIVTLLFGIALKRASVLTVVFADGAVLWLAVVPVVLPAWLVCAIAAVLNAVELLENPHVRAREGFQYVEVDGVGPAP